MRPTNLLERDRELARIAEVRGVAADGSGRLVLIEGPPGIGKTALLGRAVDEADEAGFDVLRARGNEREGGVPFGVARELLVRRLAKADESERGALLGVGGRPAAAALGLEDGLEAPSPAASAQALAWLCSNLAERSPLLLAIDDLHWSDRASLRFLEHLSGQLGDHRLMVVAALRPPKPDAPSELLALAGAADAELLRPKPLSRTASASIVQAGLGAEASEEVCATCERLSGGNPLLLRELVREAAERELPAAAEAAAEIEQLTPTTISRGVLLRLRALPADAAALAKAVAVLVPHATVARAAALAGVTADRASEMADALAGEAILAPGRPLEFAHPVLRTAVDSELPAADRSALHSSAAELLRSDGMSPGIVAAHLLQVDPRGDPEVAGTLRSAAAAARAQGAPSEAASFLRRALDEPVAGNERWAVLLETARAEYAVGLPVEEILREAVAVAPDAKSRARAALVLAEAAQTRGRLASVRDELAALLDEVGDELDPHLWAQLRLAGLDQPEYVLDAREGASEQRRAALDADIRVVQAQVQAGLISHSEGAARSREVLASTSPWTELDGSSGPWFTAIDTLLTADSYDDAQAALIEGKEQAVRAGSDTRFALFSEQLAESYRNTGRMREAEAEASIAFEVAWRGEARGRLARLTAHELARILTMRGKLDEAERVLSLIEIDENDVDHAFMIGQRARIRHARGDLEGAAADYRRFGELCEETRLLNPSAVFWRGLLATVLVKLGERDEAKRLVDADLAAVRALGDVEIRDVVLRAAGVVYGGEEGIAFLREGLEVADRWHHPPGIAETLVDLGAALCRANQRSEGRVHLRRGLELAEACGWELLAERAREELRGSGVRVARHDVFGPDSLTGSERRVAELAASGLQNKEIAQSLFVTLKTVETHMTSILRKLDISSRREIEAALAGDPQLASVDS